MNLIIKLNVIGVWKVLHPIKLLATLYLQSRLSLNNSLPPFVPLGSSKDLTENTLH